MDANLEKKLNSNSVRVSCIASKFEISLNDIECDVNMGM